MTSIERRITQFGNSLGVTLPYKMLEDLGMAKGDGIQIVKEGNQLILKKAPKRVDLPEGVTEDFFQFLDEEMIAHEKALKGLVNR